ncbi:hypothetical protein CPLU01_07392 [Colletotrichum plurivorum]|uniref:Uncharacterized protein n=1 Tax=Colletotrichum plurivorum TaxID=2175906 RepID=A0A8H6KEU9_9PEZI|nr:hypothetical protein CPLU01_07392 [Colletotrichum plurivorum]
MADEDEQHQLDVLPDPEALLQHLWPSLPRHSIRPEDYHHFFKFLREEIHKVKRAPSHYVDGLVDRIPHSIDVLVLHAQRWKVDVAEAFVLYHPTFPTPGPSYFRKITLFAASLLSEPVSRSLDVIARLWLTINLDTFPLEASMNTEHRTINWMPEDTLSEAINSRFELMCCRFPACPPDRRSIPPSFKMTTLCDRYDASICWTSNLVEHLKITWTGNRGSIMIYEHVICLRNHLQYSPGCPIPAALLEEALDTMVLLFPPDDRGTRKLLKRHGKTFWRLGRCGRERASGPNDFRYWRARIDALLEEYEKPLSGTRQLLLDPEGRNFLEFSTFWTALAVAVLTILGIGFGTIGTVYAIKAYNLSYKQYLLSQKQFMLDLVQTCVEREARERWPHICSEAV